MRHFFIFSLLALGAISIGFAQDHDHSSRDAEVYEYNVGELNLLTGEGVNIGGFIFPELFITATGGVFESGGSAEDFASSEHDPQNDVSFQAIELHLGINMNDVITGMVSGFGHQGEEDVWEAELEEAFVHVHVTDTLAVGGGQFLNTFGFQADKHLHGWEFVNQNLVNSRLLNEGELITQGGEAIIRLPELAGVFTIGGGNLRAGHGHGHEEEEEEHGHEEEEGEHDEDEDEHGHEEEEHHLEADEANFEESVVSADLKFKLPFDDATTFSTSFATGENGFGRQTHAYGFGVEKIWGAHDHGFGPEFCTGALMVRTEFIGRSVEAREEDGEALEFDDQGVSTGIFYGLSDQATISLRHDWVSDSPALELDDRHRISPALTVYLDAAQRIRARLQYDYIQGGDVESEHAAWLQFQFQWGGEGGSHRNHDH